MNAHVKAAFLERELREADSLAPGERPVDAVIEEARRCGGPDAVVAALSDALRGARGRVHNAVDVFEAQRFFKTPTALGAACTNPPGLEAFA